jgi:outer membrane protein OmpA-like peptidoglycan-associated protein
MKSLITLCIGSMALALGACATAENPNGFSADYVAPAPENVTAAPAQSNAAEPKDLTDARALYNSAAKSTAGTSQTEFLRIADQQIRDATHVLKAEGDTQRVHDLAYLALRNLQTADLMAQVEAGGGVRAGLASKLGGAGFEEKLNVSGSVLFPFGTAELLPAAKHRLDDLASALKSEPDEKVRLEGNTDSVGSDDFNKQLSISRAQAVKEYLVGQGIGEDRISTEGNGKDEPAVNNDTVDNRANNRRVDVKIEGEPQKTPEGEPAKTPAK